MVSFTVTSPHQSVARANMRVARTARKCKPFRDQASHALAADAKSRFGLDQQRMLD
jgi:hypothetical protein